MMHKRRQWSIKEVASASELAGYLAQTWTCCQGFRLGDWLYLNDSTSEDGAQEYAIMRAKPNADGTHDQVESITFGWIEPAEIEPCLRRFVDRDHRVLERLALRFHAPNEACQLCR